MPIPFPRPRPPHRYDLASEKRAISRHFERRQVPRTSPGSILVATWNLANLGVQARTEADLALIAHMLRRFDLVALQEVSTDVRHLERICELLGSEFDVVMTDPSGNFERLAFLYRVAKVRRGRLAGELALDPRRYPRRTVCVPYRARGRARVARHRRVAFQPFSRTPFLHTFESEDLRLTLANAHLYYGEWSTGARRSERLGYCRRVLEAYALARWAAESARDLEDPRDAVMVVGDLNVPRMTPADPVFRSLLGFGLRPEPYPSRTGGSNLDNDKTYDQIVTVPGSTERRIEASGVFDFDNAVFAELWDDLASSRTLARAVVRFNAHLRYHISDHRPVWIRLSTVPRAPRR
ncbi:endonuclease/exonuclease/phosphatase family protein [Myxococcota bacterium]|nr:endonuclease/exonuclease/phosphatase family protein [Myxococcota bacterium]